MAQELPTDVLEVVFGHCWDAKDCSEWSTMDPLRLPMLFLRVCSSWRKAAVSCPKIWSELSVTFDEESLEELAFAGLENSTVFETWFRLRGQKGPRRLRFVFDCDLETPFGLTLPATWQEYLQHFELITKGSHIAPILDIFTPTSQFPFLETLVVWSSKLDGFCKERDDVDLSPDAHRHLVPPHIAARLRRLWIRNYEPPHCLGQGVGETLSCLTHLVVEYPLEGISSLLIACPRLEEAVFFVTSGLDADNEAEPTSRFALRKLTLFLQRGQNDGDGDFSNLFRGWHFPSLEHLQLSCVKGRFHTLTWEDILGTAPALKELYIGPRINTYPNAGHTVLHLINQCAPFLETLILDHSQAMTHVLPVEEIRDFLSARRDCRSWSTVKTLVLVFPNKHLAQPRTYRDEPLDPDCLLKELQVFVDQGLELVVKETELPHRMILWPNFMYRGVRWRESDRRPWVEHYSTYRAFV